MKTGIAKCIFGKWIVAFEECENNIKKDKILPIINFQEKEKLKDGEQVEFKIIKKSAHLL